MNHNTMLALKEFSSAVERFVEISDYHRDPISEGLEMQNVRKRVHDAVFSLNRALDKDETIM